MPSESPAGAPATGSSVDFEKVGTDYFQQRELKKGAAGWVLLVGLGVAYVISGDYAGWNFGLAQGGWGGMPGQEAIETPVEYAQLYHLGDDPGETKNLETTHPEKIEELVNLLAKAMSDGRTTPGDVQQNEGWPMLEKEMIQRFPQLGEAE